MNFIFAAVIIFGVVFIMASVSAIQFLSGVCICGIISAGGCYLFERESFFIYGMIFFLVILVFVNSAHAAMQ